MLNQISRREKLINELSSLLSDQFIQDQIPYDLRQQAMAILGLSPIAFNEKQNFNKTEKLSLGKARKSTSIKRINNKNNLTISIDDSPKSRTNKKRRKEFQNLERTTEASQRMDKSPKYVRLSTSSSKLQKYEYESEKIKTALTKIKDIESEKVFLEEKIQELKHLIFEEKNRIDDIKFTSKNIDIQFSSLERTANSTSHNMITHKRMFQNVEEQQRILMQQLESSQNQNGQVISAIKEQQQLIGMYKMVIEELKKETKKQSKQKTVIQQELIMSKNVLEKAKQKYELLYKKTENLINKLDKGLQGILN